MKDYLNIGLIQPVQDSDIACSKAGGGYNLFVNPLIQEKVWQQILHGLREFSHNETHLPIILIPELHLPHHYLDILKKLACSLGAIIIAGLDFENHFLHHNLIRNRAALIIPFNWPKNITSRKALVLKPGKTFFSYEERKMFSSLSVREFSDFNVYLFKSENFGNFGFIICSDFFDIERLQVYQGKIQHLIIISLNKDLTTYSHMAEAIGRLVFCNVIICNSGHYGGSFVFSPYRDSIKRTIYRHEGNNLYTSQIVTLPVKDLLDAQKMDFSEMDIKTKFKASPPGYPRVS